MAGDGAAVLGASAAHAADGASAFTSKREPFWVSVMGNTLRGSLHPVIVVGDV